MTAPCRIKYHLTTVRLNRTGNDVFNVGESLYRKLSSVKLAGKIIRNLADMLKYLFSLTGGSFAMFENNEAAR